MNRAASGSSAPRRWAFVVASVAIGLIATVVPATSAALASPRPESPALADVTCPAGTPKLVRCGTFLVPIDRAHPALGTIRLFFERYLHRDDALPTLEPIVAVEGGPGYSTIGTAQAYAALFAPLMGRRDLLLLDLRGTGRSDAIDCAALQRGSGNFGRDVAECGAQLGATANLWGTANAVDDLSDLLDALGIGKVDLYGDSYGTFFSQTFAYRHGAQLRTLVLDSAYPVYGQDPWGRDTNRALGEAFRLACSRSVTCSDLGGSILERLALLAKTLSAHPVSGVGYDADGHRHRVVADVAGLISLVADAASNVSVYRELDAAGRDYTATGDAVPLFRLLAEDAGLNSSGPYREWSAGLYTAVSCHDYPQVYSMTAAVPLRKAELEASTDRLAARDPNAFAPFSVSQWVGSDVEGYADCEQWPARTSIARPVPPGARFPAVPTLVLAGDLDSLTSSSGARLVAGRFPRSTFVEFANDTHVHALGDLYGCASVIVVRFVATESAGDTGCASRLPAVRTVSRFAAVVAGAVPASPAGPSDRSTLLDRQVAAAAAETVADAIARWAIMTGTHGVGLRGGTFEVSGAPLVRYSFSNDRWAADLPVSGSALWNQTAGTVTARIRVAAGSLAMSWRTDVTGAVARIAGTLDGRPVTLMMPAP